MKYILITDIGRDTDDTLALLVLLKFHKLNKIKLLAIAVSGSKLQDRTNIIYYWLSKFSITDIVVILNLQEEFKFKPLDVYDKKVIKDVDSNTCILPYKYFKDNFKTNIKTYKNLYDFFTKNIETDINVISIAPVRPLYTALYKDNNLMKRISNIYFQGNIYYENDKLIPDIRGGGKGAYNFGNGFPNFQEIKNETQYVLDLFEKTYKLSNNNKLYFLGKQTAYLVEFNYKDLFYINKHLAEISIKKTLQFAQNTPNIFGIVFKNNIKNKKKLVTQYKTKIDNVINKKIKRQISYIEDRLKNEKSNKYLQSTLDRLKLINKDDIDSCYQVFIEFIIDGNDIYNKYTQAFLQTINKITNPYDLVLVYLVLFPSYFNFNKSEILTINDTIYKKTKHIQFNKKDKNVLKKQNIKFHMKKMLNSVFI